MRNLAQGKLDVGDWEGTSRTRVGSPPAKQCKCAYRGAWRSAARRRNLNFDLFFVRALRDVHDPVHVPFASPAR